MAYYRKNLSQMTNDEKRNAIREEMEYRTSNPTRYQYHIAVELFNTYDFLRDEWYHFPEEHFIKDRFIRKFLIDTVNDDDFPIPPAIPAEKCGIYLLGDTSFNPYTEQPEFWIKVGMASNAKQRMKSYYTHAPSIREIEFKYLPNVKKACEEEKLYHRILELFLPSSIRSERAKEWFKVSKEEYQAIAQFGFAYLQHLSPVKW